VLLYLELLYYEVTPPDIFPLRHIFGGVTDTVSYHKLFDVLKQFQNEVNDIRSERLARSANCNTPKNTAMQRNTTWGATS
ncbi:hypothetical protein Tco_0604978, partial [Tanacetum coccineum]